MLLWRGEAADITTTKVEAATEAVIGGSGCDDGDRGGSGRGGDCTAAAAKDLFLATKAETFDRMISLLLHPKAQLLMR